MLLALQLSLSLLAVLASPGQARSLEVKLPDYQDAYYNYGDLNYHYGIGDDRETGVNGNDQPEQNQQDLPSHPLDDPNDYSYSYGDPAYDYHPQDDRPAEPGTDDPQLDEEGTDEMDHHDGLPSSSEGEIDIEDDKDIEDDLANSPPSPRETRVNGNDQTEQNQQDLPSHPLDDPNDYSYSYGDPAYDYHPHDDRPAEPGTDDPQLDEEETDEVDHHDGLPSSSEGEINIEDDKDIEDDLANSPAPPEGGNDIEDEDDSTTSSVLRWFEHQWYEAKSQMERMVSELRGIKDSMVAFLYRLGDTLERGAEYCIQKLKATAQDIDSRANHVLEKLEDQLQRGNEQVVQLLRLLGIKVQEWSRQHQGTAHLDLGAVYPDNNGVPGFTIQQNDVEMMPNFFQDEAVSEQLSRLVKDDILTEEEAVILKMA